MENKTPDWSKKRMWLKPLTAAAITAFGTYFIPARALAQSGCNDTNTIIAAVEKGREVPSLDTVSFVVRLGHFEPREDKFNSQLATLLSPGEFSEGSHPQWKPTRNFGCSWVAYTAMDLPRTVGSRSIVPSFYVIAYVAPDSNHNLELTRYKQLLSTFRPLKAGPEGPPLEITSQPPPPGTSLCVSPLQDFQIACPAGWTMTQDSQSVYGGKPFFLQVNWSPRNDPTTALHVMWYQMGIPVRLKDGSLASYIDADNFAQDTLKNVFGFSEYTANPSTVSSENPRQQLTRLVGMFQKTPTDDNLLRKILDLASTIEPPPAFPAEAQRHFMKGVAAMQVRSVTQNDIETAVQEFRQGLILAPWWGDAYYNLAGALEAAGHYDDAIQQLNLYLKTKPSGSDAQEAQSRIYAIHAEKQSSAQAQEQRGQELAFKYVTGGAQRVRISDSPATWKVNQLHGTFELYAYPVPDEDPYYPNIFRMPNGRYIAILLAPQFHCDIACSYTGDEITIGDITLDPCGQMNRPFNRGDVAGQSEVLCGYSYSVSISAKPDSIVAVSYNQASVAVPVSLLYRGRALAAAWAKSNLESLQEASWVNGNGGVVELDFDDSVLKAAKNPSVDPLSLVPQRVNLFTGHVAGYGISPR